LEGIAECISGKVHAEIVGKIAATVVEMGPYQLKNIASAERVYRLGPLSASHKWRGEIACGRAGETIDCCAILRQHERQ